MEDGEKVGKICRHFKGSVEKIKVVAMLIHYKPRTGQFTEHSISFGLDDTEG